MSTPVSYAVTVFLVFLMTVLAHVHTLHMKALNNNRPRGVDDRSSDQKLRHQHYTKDEKDQMKHLNWPKFKEEVKQKYDRYEDSLAKEEKIINSAVAEPETDRLYVTESAHRAKYTKYTTDPSSKRYQKHKIHKQLHPQINSNNFRINNTHSNSSKNDSYQTENYLDANNVNSSDSLDYFVESQLEESINVSLSNDSSEGHSNADSKDNNTAKFSRCPSCEMRDNEKRHRIERLKQQIINTLQIKNMPNVTGVSIPKVPALVHLYALDADMMSDSPYGKKNNAYRNSHYQDVEYDDGFVIKTERVFTVARQAPAGIQLNLTDSAYFSPPVQLYTSRIKTAYLWFYVRQTETRRLYLTLTVDRILPESSSSNRVIAKTVFSQKLFRDKAFGWKRIDMRDTLRRWVNHPMSNYGLKILVADDAGNNLIVLPPSSDVDKGYEPWLDTKIMEQRSHSRHRRSDSLVCNSNSTESRCCRYPLYVAFAEFGWDWIIAPTHVKADYCSGECRMTMQDNTPYSWVNQQMPDTGGSCCTPTKMSPLPLLYFDLHYNVLYQILQNMKVDKCGCA